MERGNKVKKREVEKGGEEERGGGKREKNVCVIPVFKIGNYINLGCVWGEKLKGIIH